jgi:hypothetical protein
MPHFKDGTKAKIGDQVRGKSYNRGGIEEDGILVQITTESEVCNCRVWFPARMGAIEGTDFGEVRAFSLIV